MKLSKMIFSFILILTVVFSDLFFSGCSKLPNFSENAQDAYAQTSGSALATSDSVLDLSTQTETGDSVPVTRAMASKMLAMAFTDLNTINSLDRTITFTDTSADDWYDKYINAVYDFGLMSGKTDTTFDPAGYITLSEAQSLFLEIDPKSSINLDITDENKDMPISYDLWVQLYIELLTDMAGSDSLYDSYGISDGTFVVLATPQTNSQLTGWSLVTDNGPIEAVGYEMDGYVDKEISVYEKDGDIIAINGITDNAPTIHNAFFLSSDSTSVTIFSGGITRTYKYPNRLKNTQGEICDISIDGDEANDVTIYNNAINDEVMSTTTTEVEFRDKGIVPFEAGFKVYEKDGDAVHYCSLNDIIVGTDVTDFYMDDGKICGAVIEEKPTPNVLRVAISDSDYGSLYHKNVSLTSNEDFVVTHNGKKDNYKAGDVFDVKDNIFDNCNRIYITPSKDDGKITITSITRTGNGGASPTYRGSMEISKSDSGYIIVNDVPMDDYLYAVVPSEMPSSYGSEPSKAQAITARSYAYNEYYENRFHQYGANLDDSVSCQMYNNYPENETSIEAVDATSGEYLTYEGEVISANFFSTSCGTTASSGEVWPDSATSEFPTQSPVYLSSEKQYDGDDFGDLSNEDNAAKFFKTTDIDAIEKDNPWFRWSVTMSTQQISSSVNANIGKRYEIKPQEIETLQSDGHFRSVPINSVGTVTDLEVVERGEGGNVMEMKITGTDATVLVKTEYNIRDFFAPKKIGDDESDITLTLNDGSKVTNYSLLPSAFFTFDKTYDTNGNLNSVVFYGGGNGHGVGMSQNGAEALANSGYTYDEILAHYYPGTDITNLE